MKREEEGKKRGMKKENEEKYEEEGKKFLEEIPSADLQSLLFQMPLFLKEFLNFLQFYSSCLVCDQIVHIFLVV